MVASRAGYGREEGLTLVELLVAMSILSIVLASVYALLFSVQNGFERQVDRSTSLDQARLAMVQMDREIRSASAFTVLREKADGSGLEESPDGYGIALDAYTRTNEVSVSGAGRGDQMCVEWRVTSDGLLQTRMWSPDDIPEKLAWRTTASDVVNSDTTGGWLFQIPKDDLYNGRLLNVRILVDSSPASGINAAPTVEVRSSLSGRNVNQQPDPCFAKISAGEAPD